MTTIVGIFDDAGMLEKVAERLAGTGVDTAVLDEGILAQEAGSVDPLGPTLAPGSTEAIAGTAGSEAPNLIRRRDKHSIDRAFKARLSKDYHLPGDVIEGYATTFAHSGKFLLVNTEAERAEEVSKVLQDSGATRVNRHD
jgi:hypothetical protein